VAVNVLSISWIAAPEAVRSKYWTLFVVPVEPGCDCRWKDGDLSEDVVLGVVDMYKPVPAYPLFVERTWWDDCYTDTHIGDRSTTRTSHVSHCTPLSVSCRSIVSYQRMY
jgi:hypothetical protein